MWKENQAAKNEAKEIKYNKKREKKNIWQTVQGWVCRWKINNKQTD